MSCDDSKLLTSNQPRWALAWRRIATLVDGLSDPLRVRAELQPVIVVSDASYAVGKPGWRGVITDTSSPAVAARRAAIAIMAQNAPVTVQWLNPDDDVDFVVRSVESLRTLMANTTTITAAISQSGDQRQGAGAASTVVLQSADLDPAALPAPTMFASPDKWPNPNLSIEVPLGFGLLMWGDTNNQNLFCTMEVTEHKAFG